MLSFTIVLVISTARCFPAPLIFLLSLSSTRCPFFFLSFLCFPVISLPHSLVLTFIRYRAFHLCSHCCPPPCIFLVSFDSTQSPFSLSPPMISVPHSPRLNAAFIHRLVAALLLLSLIFCWLSLILKSPFFFSPLLRFPSIHSFSLTAFIQCLYFFISTPTAFVILHCPCSLWFYFHIIVFSCFHPLSTFSFHLPFVASCLLYGFSTLICSYSRPPLLFLIYLA